MPLTILEGSTFCICDDSGDVDGPTTGLYAEDTRFLSRCVLTINGERPQLLSSRLTEHHAAVFFLRNPVAGGLRRDELSIVRQRFVGLAMQDELVVQSHARRRVEFELALELASDFADIFAGKEQTVALSEPLETRPLPAPVPVAADAAAALVLADPAGSGRTQIVLSEGGEIDGGAVRYRVGLDPRQQWRLRLDVLPMPESDGAVQSPERIRRRLVDERERGRTALHAWRLGVPRLRSAWTDLERVYERSIADLASLRMRSDGRELLAAGMPWFMTVFGRDALVTSLQTLLLGPELARNALVALAGLQATEDDPAIDAEPGKIVHEVRRGKGAAAWLPRYYGTLDATPLYLVLLGDVWRWTADAELARDLRDPALRALEWIDRHGDQDGDGFLEYLRRSPVGNANQSWKDSWDSQLHADGSLAEPPLAPAEVQGYVYAAKLRLAEVAREAWRDRELAARLEREAEELRARFDAAFWIEERGGYYALALDRDKRRVDSLASNLGHLLWSGIVPPERVEAVADALMRPELWSGWGVRTMSSADAGYNPLGYHTGTVWPHDNAFAAWGLAEVGRVADARRVARATLDAAVEFGYQLPEAYAGFSRDEVPFPVPYPTATRPQAWAAGTPVLLLQVLLGLRPNARRQVLESVEAPELPRWLGTPSLAGVRAFDRVWSVRTDGGAVRVEAGD